MRPLKRITAIKEIANSLENRGFSWDEVYSYLHEYNHSVHYYTQDDWNSIAQYVMNQCIIMRDDDISSMYEELMGRKMDEVMADTDTSLWKAGYYRLFISHLTEEKEAVGNLKRCLLPFGIDCFVAHEDIQPTKEWLKVIRQALFSADALCAVFSPGFSDSDWCDQEVGFALGRRIPTFSVLKGETPHGFLSEFQAIASKQYANDVAEEVHRAICSMPDAVLKYSEVLSKLLLDASNVKEALQWIEIILKTSSFPESLVENIYEGHKSNQILTSSEEVLTKINALFKRINRRANKTPLFSDDDLPF